MLTMNDIKQYERPARAYCAKLGLNPEEIVLGSTLHSVNGAPSAGLQRWMPIAEQMINLSLMLVSMKESLTTPQIILPN